ncbi:MAG: hypothetical protein WEC34_10960 [Acidimicrobiia bacterium]
MRLRQAVLAARDLPAAKACLEERGLRDPFRDPGVEEFGLDNAVYAVGDAFLEVVSPIREGTTAGRFLERCGREDPVGYMVIVQVDDLDDVRARAEKLGIRSVWSIDLDDIRATHLHPKDVGAILSVDQPADPASWRWGGPDWAGRAVAGRLRAVEIAADPERWSALLDRGVLNGVMGLDDGTELRFVDGDPGVVAIELDVGLASIRLV